MNRAVGGWLWRKGERGGNGGVRVSEISFWIELLSVCWEFLISLLAVFLHLLGHVLMELPYAL